MRRVRPDLRIVDGCNRGSARLYYRLASIDVVLGRSAATRTTNGTGNRSSRGSTSDFSTNSMPIPNRLACLNLAVGVDAFRACGGTIAWECQHGAREPTLRSPSAAVSARWAMSPLTSTLFRQPPPRDHHHRQSPPSELRRGDRLFGVECKRADAPRVTPSMRIALEDVGLERIAVVHPKDKRYPIADRIEAVPLRDLATPAGLFGGRA